MWKDIDTRHYLSCFILISNSFLQCLAWHLIKTPRHIASGAYCTFCSCPQWGHLNKFRLPLIRYFLYLTAFFAFNINFPGSITKCIIRFCMFSAFFAPYSTSNTEILNQKNYNRLNFSHTLTLNKNAGTTNTHCWANVVPALYSFQIIIWGTYQYYVTQILYQKDGGYASCFSLLMRCWGIFMFHYCNNNQRVL